MGAGLSLALARAGVSGQRTEDQTAGLIWAGAWLIGDRRRVLRARVADQVDHARREHEVVVAEERARIARELHDSAGHALNTILVQAGAARVLRERDRERSAQAVATIEDLARETIEEIDRIVGLLRDDREMDRSPLPGIDQIPALVERQRAGGLDVHLTIEGTPDRQPPTSVSSAAMTERVRVMLVDDDHLLRSGVRAILSSDESIDVVDDSGERQARGPACATPPPRRRAHGRPHGSGRSTSISSCST
ncbi:MAG TPA: histidine kinase [Solirubrobacteraceae bacterium]|nr:histidine kinase [Solirubrobacteraceae bacterium]